jgi:hypothetical protein
VEEEALSSSTHGFCIQARSCLLLLLLDIAISSFCALRMHAAQSMPLQNATKQQQQQQQQQCQNDETWAVM